MNNCTCSSNYLYALTLLPTMKCILKKISSQVKNKAEGSRQCCLLALLTCTTGILCKILTMTVKYIHMPMKPGAQDIHVSMHLSGAKINISVINKK